jgi:hypothetical protein
VRLKWENLKDSNKRQSVHLVTWEPKEHAHQWIIYPENIGTHLAIDEVVLSQENFIPLLLIKAKGKRIIGCYSCWY